MEAPKPIKEEESMPLARKVLLSAIAVVTVCATSAPIVITSAEAQQRYYRQYHPRTYYAPRSYGYSRSAPYYGSYGGSYGGYYGGGSYGGSYGSTDSNGQRRTGSDAGNFGGGPGGG
jgi:hypothetical protein